jgi:putative transposase
MARLARVIAPKLPHHVIQRGVRSMEIFATDDDRELYLVLLAEFAARYEQ